MRKATQAVISLSIQPTLRAPKLIGAGNSERAIFAYIELRGRPVICRTCGKRKNVNDVGFFDDADMAHLQTIQSGWTSWRSHCLFLKEGACVFALLCLSGVQPVSSLRKQGIGAGHWCNAVPYVTRFVVCVKRYLFLLRRLGRSKVAYDHLGFIHDSIHIIGPPLEHLFSLLCVLGNDVDGANSLGFMTQSLFDHIAIEALLG